jgi:hypothetical protein
MKLTKKQALEKIEELKKYIAEKDKEEPRGYVIKNRYNNSEIFVSTKNNVRDAVIEAVEQGVSLVGANLKEANLVEADLFEADLFEANLAGANLREANLVEADLRKADLEGADLFEASLVGANLAGANLKEADLREADLEGAELFNAKFYGKGGTSKLKRNQVEAFLKALGFIVED